MRCFRLLSIMCVLLSAVFVFSSTASVAQVPNLAFEKLVIPHTNIAPSIGGAVYHPDHVVDGDVGTVWYSWQGIPTEVSFTIDLEEIYEIGSIEILPLQLTSYTIETSLNNSVWVTRHQGSLSLDYRDLLVINGFTPYEARYVKFTGSNYSNAYAGLAEIRVYGQVFPVGDGTAENPYEIATADQLYAVRDYLDKHFILIDDIDLDIPPYNTGEGWMPIGSFSDRFFGTFNGGGYTISNLFINRDANYIGLFGYIEDTEISNLTLDNVSVTGRSDVGALAGAALDVAIDNIHVTGTVAGNSAYGGSIGGLVGYAQNMIVAGCSADVEVTGHQRLGGLVGEQGMFSSGTARIENSHTAGSVSGRYDVGGFVGENKGVIVSSYATAVVQATNSNAGGLVGENSGEIIDSYAVGMVSGGTTDAFGGLVGFNRDSGIIRGSYASGAVSVTGLAEYIGGLVGQNSGLIEKSFATGAVNGQFSVGGLVGYQTGGSTKDAYATGSVSAVTNSAGGLIGEASGTTITNTFAIGAVSGTERVGGLVGEVRGTNSITASFYNSDTSGQNDIGKGESRTTAELLEEATFTGWEIVADDTIDQGYPSLTWQVSQSYSGDPDPIWVIGTKPPAFSVTPAVVGPGGIISPDSVQTISNGATTQFTITPQVGYFIVGVTGCGGSLTGNTYTTAAITQACSVIATFQPTAVDPVDPDPVDPEPILPVLIEKDYFDAPLIVASHRLTRHDPQSGAILSITRAHSEVPNSSTSVNDEDPDNPRVTTAADIEKEGRNVTLQAEAYGDGMAVHRVVLLAEGAENKIITQALSRFTGAFTLMEEGRVTTWAPLPQINNYQWRVVVETQPDGESRLWYEVCETQCDNDHNWALSSVTLPGDQAFEAGNEIEVGDDLLEGVQMRIKTNVTREIRF